MKSDNLEKILINLGLTDGESRVYLVSLNLGPATILKISRAAEIKRTTVYSIVDSLKQKGLVNVEIKGWKKLFVAENPEKLDSILETRRRELKNNLPQLLAMYNLKGDEGFIKYYEGIEGIKTVYEGLLRDIQARDEYMVIADPELWYDLDQKYFADFIKRRAKLNINIRMLLQDSDIAREHKKFEKNFNDKIKLLPENTAFTANIVITPQKIVFHQLTQPIMALVVENKSIIKTHQEIFELMWKYLPEKKEK
jgi:HTH-type transcriptional regulator, sugar sensing transcriptional regulator